DVLLFFDVRVVHPDDRAAFAVRGARALRYGPLVGARCARLDAELLARAVVVLGALGVLRVEDAVRMQAVPMLAVVLEDDLDRVADFRAHERTHHPEMLPLARTRFERLE